MKLILLTLVVLLSGCNQDQVFAYTDEQLAMAIYQAEGGRAAQYPFGIRSVYCGSWTDCKRICKETIKNNRIRFTRSGYQGSEEYLEYLAGRYSPCRGRDRETKNPNCNWLKNVKYYLEKE